MRKGRERFVELVENTSAKDDLGNVEQCHDSPREVDCRLPRYENMRLQEQKARMRLARFRDIRENFITSSQTATSKSQILTTNYHRELI